MKTSETIDFIVNWIKNYKEVNRVNGFVVGVSGGIDSALTSTLCAMTGINTLCLNMPIRQKEEQYNRANKHINWLKNKFKNVNSIDIDLTNVFNEFKSSVENNSSTNNLALANSRSRIRMTTLYYYAGINNSIVVGTGNKVEDFGIGFYTKYGDGGVDISPIADLMKSEVYELAKDLCISSEIINAPPTDGLWDDGRTDEEQLGVSYDQLEWAMLIKEKDSNIFLSEKDKNIINKYIKHRSQNLHKMNPIPVFKKK